MSSPIARRISIAKDLETNSELKFKLDAIEVKLVALTKQNTTLRDDSIATLVVNQTLKSQLYIHERQITRLELENDQLNFKSAKQIEEMLTLAEDKTRLSNELINTKGNYEIVQSTSRIPCAHCIELMNSVTERYTGIQAESAKKLTSCESQLQFQMNAHDDVLMLV